ncbi:MAG: reverse transcriptase-like protein [Alphaproteobacteria bacterium]|nr:reverse transcriptase-like protein [Alphaproteobacteria bacterium]
MRYSDKAGAKIYRANIGNLDLDPDADPIELPEGETADDQKAAPAKPSKASKGSGFGKAGTRTASQAAKAAEHARERLDALDASTTVVFTDGGCSGNPGPAGSGVYARFADGRWAEVSKSLGRGTNNIAELTAIDIALDLLDEADLPADAPVVVFSDSDYANGVLTKGWKAKKNTELILGLRAKLKARPGVDLQWVAGHVGVEGNERADRLANAGVAGRSDVRWGS